MCSLKKHEKKVALPLARHISKGDHKTQGGTNRKNQWEERQRDGNTTEDKTGAESFHRSSHQNKSDR